MNLSACAFLLAITAAVALGSPSQWDTKEYDMNVGRHPPPRPRICKRVKCAPYKVLKRYRTFEERQYDASTWAQTTVTSDCIYKALYIAYKRLAAYVAGGNAKNQTLNETAPLSIFISSPKNKTFDFTMRYFIPAGAPAPAPENKNVTVKSYGTSKAYVRSFLARRFSLLRCWVEIKRLAFGIRRINGKVLTNGWYLGLFTPPHPHRRHVYLEVALAEKPAQMEEENYDLASLFEKDE